MSDIPSANIEGGGVLSRDVLASFGKRSSRPSSLPPGFRPLRPIDGRFYSTIYHVLVRIYHFYAAAPTRHQRRSDTFTFWSLLVWFTAGFQVLSLNHFFSFFQLIC